MNRRTPIYILTLAVLGSAAWIDYTERKAETYFSAEGEQIRVLEAKAQGGVTKIIEPNGAMSVFSDQVKKKELSRIAERQRSPVIQLEYFYHRIKRFIKRKRADQKSP